MKNRVVQEFVIFVKKSFNSQMVCEDGHYVCDSCHSLNVYSIITDYCLNIDSINPMEILLDLMKHPSINMHGHEHHYLIPAVLITAYVNKENKNNLDELLYECQKRSKNSLGGFCGYYGACDAAIGCGIYMSIIQNSGSLDREEWGLCNLITSKALKNISANGGPKCCKRNAYHAIRTAIVFTKEYLNVKLVENTKPSCKYSNINQTCLKEYCPYFNKK